MEIKKSDKANLDKQRRGNFMLGLVLALAMLFAALEFTTRPAGLSEDDKMLDDLPDELNMTPVVEQKDMISATGNAGTPSKVITQKVQEVPKTVATQEISPVTSKLVIGNGEGITRQADVTEALPQVPITKDSVVLKTVEQLPEFPGGIVQFMKWLTRNLRYPPIAQSQRIQGKVVVSFIINKDGSIASPTIVQSVDPILDREALRVVKMMPRWKPGLQNGKPCRTMFAIPVNFQL
ncbi:MAG: energy transducer TonB [Prevotellaceae bacterium]|nr:energy transducer TonB [Prevotellaceae bacterium]